MSSESSANSFDAADRAALSHGESSSDIHRAVLKLVQRHGIRHDVVIDIGCGTAGLASAFLADVAERYVGCDVNRYPGFPEAPGISFVKANLDMPPYPIADGAGSLVVAVEVIEHLENPRAFFRELVRIVRPGGRLVVTTPNQTSLLSKMSLVLRNQFVAFQERPGLYPTHITALVPEDLARIARECGLVDVEVVYTDSGRIPGTARAWPVPLRGRWFSDNVLVTARRPR